VRTFASVEAVRVSTSMRPRHATRPEAGSSTKTTIVPSRTVCSRGSSDAAGVGWPPAVSTSDGSGAPTRRSAMTVRRTALAWKLTSMSAAAGSAVSTNPLCTSSATTAPRICAAADAANSGGAVSGRANSPPFQANVRLLDSSTSGAANVSTLSGMAQAPTSATAAATNHR